MGEVTLREMTPERSDGLVWMESSMGFARWLSPVDRATLVVSLLGLGDLTIRCPKHDVFGPFFAELENWSVVAVAIRGQCRGLSMPSSAVGKLDSLIRIVVVTPVAVRSELRKVHLEASNVGSGVITVDPGADFLCFPDVDSGVIPESPHIKFYRRHKWIVRTI